MKLKTLKELTQPYKELDEYLSKTVWEALKKEYPEDLKDIELQFKREEESWIQVKELREESIKWIKDLRKKSEIMFESADTDTQMRVNCYAAQGNWIKHFFNITDEALK